MSLLKISQNLVQSSILPDHKLDVFGSGRLSANAFRELSMPPVETPSEIPMEVAVDYLETCKFSQHSTSNNVELEIRDYTWRDYMSFFEPAASTFYLKLRKGSRKIQVSSFLIPKILYFWPKYDDIFGKLGLVEDDWIVKLFDLNVRPC